MNEVAHHLRKAIIDRLTGNVTVGGSAISIVNRVGSSINEPFVKVTTVSANEIDQNAGSFNIQIVIRFDVITSFDGDDGGELTANQIVDQILNQVRTRSSTYMDLSANDFNIYATEVDSISYDQNYSNDKTYFNAVVDVVFRIQNL